MTDKLWQDQAVEIADQARNSGLTVDQVIQLRIALALETFVKAMEEDMKL